MNTSDQGSGLYLRNTERKILKYYNPYPCCLTLLEYCWWEADECQLYLAFSALAIQDQILLFFFVITFSRLTTLSDLK